METGCTNAGVKTPRGLNLCVVPSLRELGVFNLRRIGQTEFRDVGKQESVKTRSRQTERDLER